MTGPDVPVYLSAAEIARRLGMGRHAVHNAYYRGAIRASADVDAWRASLWQRRSPARRGRKPASER